MRRALAVVVVSAVAASCGGVDKQKFKAVYTSGQALQTEVESNRGAPSAQTRDRLKQFDGEVAALRDHTIGRREADALEAYAEAADAYRDFLRFRSLETEGGMIQLKGPNLEAATKYKLPVDNRNNGKWVNSAQAFTILLQAAEQHLTDGNRIVDGR
jgi:TolA-binding protein